MGLTIEMSAPVNNTMHRKIKGQMTEVLVGRDDYVEPKDQEHLLKITGYSDSFEMAAFEAGKPPVTKTKIEFEIAQGRQKGGRFSCLFTLSLHERANLGAVLRAAYGGEFAPGTRVDLDDCIGKVLYASTRMELSPSSGNSYAKVTAPRPYEPEDDEDDAPVAAKAAKAANPFTDDDGE